MSLEGACGGITIDICAGGGSSNTFSNTASISFSVVNSVVMASVIPGGIDHNSLANLTVGNPHTQYALISSLAAVATTGAYSDLTGKPTLITAHSALSGLTTGDDHTQYALLIGRSTPQQLAFGSASGATAGFLTSTSNATKGKYSLNAAGTSVFDELNNRLGLNVSSPTQQLDMTGNINMPGTSSAGGSIMQGGTRVLHWYGTQNFFVGANVGNITLTGSANFAMGDTVMNHLTSGSDNSAMGVAALRDITGGTANIALGSSAGIQLTTGSKNVLVGNFSGFGIKANNSNVAIGYTALSGGSLTGASNIGIGESSGNLITSGSFNILIGDQSNVSSSAINNAIAIGKNALAGATNTGVLGATGTDAVIFGVCAGQSTSYAKIGGGIFNHFVDAGNSTTTETDLYSDTIPASTLSANGATINAEYGGVFVSSATATREIKIYFGGMVIFDTGALTLSLSSAWTAYATIIRVSSTVIRYMVSFTTEGAALSAYTAVGELTGLTLTNANILKITGQAAGVGAATNDIVAKLGTVSWFPAA